MANPNRAQFTKCASYAIPSTTMALLHYRGLQRLHLQAVAQHGHVSRVAIPLNFQALTDLKWWLSEREHLNGCPVQQTPIDDATIWSDPSKKGWGAAYRGISTGHWSVEEAKGHINVLELRAATLALKAPVTELSASGAQTCPLTFRQYNSSGLYQPEGGGGGGETHSPALTT